MPSDQGTLFYLLIGEAELVGDCQDDAAQHPARRISQGNRQDGVADVMGHDEKIYLSEEDKGEEHGHHGDAGPSGTPEGASVDLVEAGKQIERGEVGEEHGSVVDDPALFCTDECYR